MGLLSSAHRTSVVAETIIAKRILRVCIERFTRISIHASHLELD